MTMFELLVTTEFHGVNKNLTDQMMQKHVPRYQKWTLTCWGHLCAHCYTITGPPPAYNYGARLHITMFELFVTTEFHGVSKNMTDQRMQKHVPRYLEWTLTCWDNLCAHCYTITGPPPAYNYGVRLHMRLMLRVRRMEMWICLLNFYHHRLQHHHYQHHHLDPGVAYNYGCALAPTKGQLWMRIMWEGEIWIQTKVAGI